MTFSVGKKAPFSALLYAEAFGLGVAEAESDLSVGDKNESVHTRNSGISSGGSRCIAC